MRKCSKKTKSGKACRAPALIGSSKCLFHNRAAGWAGSQVKSGAGRYVREKTYRSLKKRFK